MRYSGGIDVVSAQFAAVNRSQHKDVPDLNASYRGEFPAAFGAAVAGLCQRNIGDNIRRKITRIIDVFNMGVRFIAARNEISAGIYGIVSHNLDTFKPNRRSRTGDNTLLFNFGVGGQPQILAVQIVFQFNFVDL